VVILAQDLCVFGQQDRAGSWNYSRHAIGYGNGFVQGLFRFLPFALPIMQPALNVKEFDAVHGNGIFGKREDGERPVQGSPGVVKPAFLDIKGCEGIEDRACIRRLAAPGLVPRVKGGEILVLSLWTPAFGLE
jgi:hypothetical protein